MQAHGFALDNESVTNALYDSLITAFEEDRKTIMAQQRMLSLGEPKFVPIAADAALNQFRQLIRKLADAEQADAAGIASILKQPSTSPA
jgi:vanillate O-demethylase monooxygenase subunit